MKSKKYRNNWMLGSFCLCVVLMIAGCDRATDRSTIEPAKGTTSSRPNILIVLADDMGYEDIGAFGSEIETPNIDKLVSQGMSFTNYHVGAACAPTRAMLMTGVDNHMAGMGNMLEIQADNQFGKPGYEGHLNDKVVTVATRLKDAGVPHVYGRQMAPGQIGHHHPPRKGIRAFVCPDGKWRRQLRGDAVLRPVREGALL